MKNLKNSPRLPKNFWQSQRAGGQKEKGVWGKRWAGLFKIRKRILSKESSNFVQNPKSNNWRRGRDSNPRYQLSLVQSLSRRP